MQGQFTQLTRPALLPAASLRVGCPRHRVLLGIFKARGKVRAKPR